jgi:pyruvate formate lyase activating enzyme
MASIAERLDALTREGELYEKREDSAVRCCACAHRCLIREGKRGICKVRFNQGGTLRVPWEYVSSIQVDPIEKKPFYHFLAGEDALTFGMLGCDFHCSYCQNWLTSQTLRDLASDRAGRYIQRLTSAEIAAHGKRQGARVVASSYNEPLITAEWAVDIFSQALKANMKAVFVSNGHATPEALEYLQPYLSGFKVDLKSMRETRYQELGGNLAPVLDSIQLAHEMGMWVEVVTLLVPDYNDSREELVEMARFIASVSPDIPWHVSAFRPTYKMIDRRPTSWKDLLRAARIGQEHGLRYVYLGNIPGHVGEFEHTHCPDCQTRLISRYGYMIQDYRITAQGTCSECGTDIPGVWTDRPEDVNLRGSGFPRPIW